MGLDCYLSLLLGFQRVGLLKREGKDFLLMHAFLLCFLSFLITFPFRFSLLFLSQFFLFSCLRSLYPSIYSYCSYLYWANYVGFLSSTLMAHQPFLSVMNSSSELSSNPLVARPLLSLGMLNMFSPSHCPITRQIPIWLVLLWAFPPCLNR